MTLTKAQAQANGKYLAKFDDIKIRVPKGEREKWQAHAASKGKSLNAYIIDLVEADIQKPSGRV